MGRVGHFVNIVDFSGSFFLLRRQLLVHMDSGPVGVIGSNLGVDYLIVGNDILVVLYIGPANFPL